MVQAAAFPDVEALLVPYLTGRLTARGRAARVATKIPNPRPARLVKVTRTGGVRRNVVTDAPTVMVECWDVDDVAAADLARIVRAEVHALADDAVPGVAYRSDVGGLANWPDHDSENSRYTFTVELLVRGSVI